MKTKLKTKKAAAKRFKLTATGKVKVKRANMRHILSDRSRKVKRKARKGAYAPACEKKHVQFWLPYGSVL